MAIYVTKVWGFGPPVGPLQFSSQGWRENAREKLQPGDFVILVGTKSDPTEFEDQGRLLGMMEPTLERVASRDFEMETRASDYDEQGEYRWPFGLLIRKAWRFLEPRPELDSIIERRLSMDAALGIVKLSDSEAKRITDLPREEVEILAPTKAFARIHGNETARRRGAPPPTTTRTGIMHLREAPAYTYLMKLEGSKIESYKIGWAFNYQDRMKVFNAASMPKLGGINYKTELFELHETAKLAFTMEQALLNEFDNSRHPSNREVIHGVSYETLRSAWIAKLSRKSSKKT